MSTRDRLKNSQGGATSYPKFEAHFYMSAKRDEKGKPSFRYRQNEEDKYSHTPIEGVLIGTAFQMGGYSKKQKKFYKTFPYWRRNYISLSQGRGQKPIRGTKEEIKGYLMEQGVNPSIKMLLFIATESEIVVVLSTNCQIAIDNLKSHPKGTFLDRMVVVTPKMYAPGEASLGASVHESLSDLSDDKYPCYADITVGGELTDAILEKVEPVLTEYEAYKEFNDGTREEEEKQSAEAEQDEGDGGESSDKPKKRQMGDGDLNDPDDDLPF